MFSAHPRKPERLRALSPFSSSSSSVLAREPREPGDAGASGITVALSRAALLTHRQARSAPTRLRLHGSRRPPPPRSNSPPSCSSPFLSVALKKLPTHVERASSIRCQRRTALPRCSPLARSSSFPAFCSRMSSRSLSVLKTGQKPVGPFVLVCGRHHPVPLERAEDCPALELVRVACSDVAPTQTFSPAYGVSITSLTSARHREHHSRQPQQFPG